MVDEKGNPTEEARKVFSTHAPDAFNKEFSKIVKGAYAGLFGLHADKTWNLNKDDLVAYFRNTDRTASIIGQRQASTFKTLSSLCGYGNPIDSEIRTGKKLATSSGRVTKKINKNKDKGRNNIPANTEKTRSGDVSAREVGLTVRIEINLPVSDDKKTYDNIFKSIKENLLNG